MISEATFNGLSRELTFSTNQTLGYGARIHLLFASVGSRTISLPDARRLPLGWPMMILANIGSNAFAVNDNAGGSIAASVAANQWLVLALLVNTTQAGTWVADLRTKLS